MNFTINGRPVAVEVDVRTSLLDLLRDHLHLTGTKKGCNQGACGACTVLVDGERINLLPGPGGAVPGARDHDDRGPGGRRTRCTRCRRRSSSMTASSAATARRGRSARPSAWRGEWERGVPSDVTADLTADTRRARPRRAARADERQSLPLRRVQRHRRGDRAPRVVRGGRAMTPFPYERAPRTRQPRIRLHRRPAPSISRGGTNLVDLMRETVERPAALVDVSGLSSDHRGARRRRAGDRRGRQEHGRGQPPGGARPLPDAGPRHPRRRFGADPQHGHASAATSCSARAAPTSTTTPRAATSASPARAATRSTASTASTPSWAPRPPAWRRIPSDMCVALAALDAIVHLEGPDGRAHAAAGRSAPAAGRPTRHRDRAGARRADHRGRAAAAAVRGALDLSQGARPGELRLRAGLGGGRAGGRRRTAPCATCGWRSAASRTSPGAPGRPRRRCAAARRRREAFRAAAEAELAGRRRPPRQRVQDRARQADDRRRLVAGRELAA